MSDELLRELERRWRESGASADAGAWIEARVRAGDLGRQFGGLGELLAAGAPLEDYGRRLGCWGKGVCARAALALLERGELSLEGTLDEAYTAAQALVERNDAGARGALASAMRALRDEERCPVSVPPTGGDYDLSPYEPELQRWRALKARPERALVRSLEAIVTGSELQRLSRILEWAEPILGEAATRACLDAAIVEWVLATDEGATPTQRLLAYAGDPEACASLGMPPPVRAELEDREGWLAGLLPFGARCVARVAAHAADHFRHAILSPYGAAAVDEVLRHHAEERQRPRPALRDLRRGFEAHLALCPALDAPRWAALAQADRRALEALLETLRGEDPLPLAQEVVAWSPLSRGDELWAHARRACAEAPRPPPGVRCPDPDLLRAERKSVERVVQRLARRLHEGSLEPRDLLALRSVGYPAPEPTGEALPLASAGTALWARQLATRCGLRLGIVAATGALRAAVRLQITPWPAPQDTLPRCLSAADAWVAEPTPERAEAAASIGKRAIRQAINTNLGRLWMAAGACCTAISAPAGKAPKLVAVVFDQARRLLPESELLAGARAEVFAHVLSLPAQTKATVRLAAPGAE